MAKRKRRYHCALCQQWFKKQEMSEEHFPAKTVGNVDMVEVNAGDMFDPGLAKLNTMKINSLMDSGLDYDTALDMIFEENLVKKSYPKGRTTRTLCRQCNTLLGKYDSSYKKFFEKDGNVAVIKGFQKHTKIQIIKSIYGKFLSIPECEKESFDFRDFLLDEQQSEYSGRWKICIVKRSVDTDILSMKSLNTGTLHFKEGDLYEFSDDKFIYHLMNFECHPSEKEMNFWDILNDSYEFIPVSKKSGGYHGQLLLSQLLESD